MTLTDGDVVGGVMIHEVGKEQLNGGTREGTNPLLMALLGSDADLQSLNKGKFDTQYHEYMYDDGTNYERLM
uniref:Uncharacterized protein n=1 Tax=Setaria digitata TaxID=48799 RepID=A0A915PJU2_9BILA